MRPARQNAGIVDQIAGQFTDPYAFVRELVQNAIDAGATQISVAIDEQSDEVWTSVTDDGSGMTLEVIEGPLLTIFSSGKEGDDKKLGGARSAGGEPSPPDKIGRYGVGFMSVFAMSPTRVVVETWSAAGAFVVTLRPDHTYEVRRASNREGSGTSVSIARSAADSPPDHRERLSRALRAWCRHVEIPIDLVHQGEPTRINRPLAVGSAISVSAVRGRVRAVVGAGYGGGSLSETDDHLLTDAAASVEFAGFYGRGLTILESRAVPPALAGIRFKVESSAFSYTISRDDVRRDAVFAEAMELVTSLVRNDLRSAAASALREAAELASVDPTGFARYATLLAACVALGVRGTVVALVEPFDGARVLPLEDARTLAESGRLLGESARSPSTAVAARLEFAVALTEVRAPGAPSIISTLLRAPVPDLAARLLLAVPNASEQHPSLSAALLEVLRFVGCAVERVVWVDVLSPRPNEVFEHRVTWFVDPRDEPPWAVNLLRTTSGTLLVAAASRVVMSACRARDERAAAALLARLALLEMGGAPDEETNDRLLAWSAQQGRDGAPT
ncbi:MAG: ATP-binding protein [Polyangiaceae bacterium]